MRQHTRPALFLSELLGTAALLLVGVSAAACFFGNAAVLHAVPGYWPRILAVLFCFGAVIVAVIKSPCGHISGSHINPAVSIAMAAAGRLPVSLLPLYLAAQCAGAVLGAWLAGLLWGQAALAVKFATTLPQPAFPLWATMLAEGGGTALLLWLVFACQSHRLKRYEPWLIGTYIFIYGSLTAQISGASFNPARSLGSAVISGDYHYLWLYLLFPTLGALLPVLVCRLRAQGQASACGEACTCCVPQWRAMPLPPS